MKHLLSQGTESLIERFAWSHVLLAFDFDGTLAPIVDQPGEARMRAGTRKLLATVAARYPCVIVSGRSQADVRARLEGIPVAAIVGNHGLEPTVGMERFAKMVAQWKPVLTRELGAVQGVEIEDKTYSVAIHYRRSRNKRAAQAAISSTISALRGSPRIVGGKLVVNLVPAGAPHKGIAVEQWRRRLGLDTAIYVGDDITDEDVFALDQPGRLLSVRVGKSATTHANYYLRHQGEMDRLLSRLATLREKSKATTVPAAVGPEAEPTDRPESELPELGPTLEFLALIWELNHALDVASSRLKQKHGITGQQRMVLRIVGRFPGISAGQLAALLRIHPGTLSASLARLSRRGLLLRQRDPRDKRRVVLGLTPRGRDLNEPLPGTMEDAVQAVLESTKPADIERTRHVLRALVSTLR